MNFTKDILETAIKNLASKGKIYSNESQFQFELACELSKLNFSIELEVLSCNKLIADFVKLKKEEKQKYYTDIIVKDEEGSYVAIELKYKTVEKNIEYTTQSGRWMAFSQGAENQGAYYFWKDVQRLEDLVKNKVPLNFDDSKRVSHGYAVLLTNSSKYWYYNSSSTAREFFPAIGRTFANRLCWYGKYNITNNQHVHGKTKIGGSIGEIRLNCEQKVEQYKPQNGKIDDFLPIELKNCYTIGNNDWRPYSCGIAACKDINGKTNGQHKYDEFKYLIIEINSKDNLHEKLF